VLLPTVGATAGTFLVVIAAGVRALGRRPMLGSPGLVGQVGVTRSRLAPEGQATVQGEIWRAIAEDGPIDEGVPVRIVDVQGLTLKVVKANNPGGAS
jgi:membrane-bound ClpP family serine protease